MRRSIGKRRMGLFGLAQRLRIAVLPRIEGVACAPEHESEVLFARRDPTRVQTKWPALSAAQREFPEVIANCIWHDRAARCCSFREMLGPSCIAGILGSRFRGYFDPLFGYRLNPACNMYYGRPRTPGRPLVLIVSPYAVYPPAHGGARRIHELISRLSSEFDIVLLSDEMENYSTESLKYFRNCHAVCLVGGRKADPARDGRIDRILSHSHAALAAQLRALIVIYDPDVVQVEYVELARLVEAWDRRPWILILHDILLNGLADEPSKADKFELRYINQFDVVVTCSPEDRALLQRDNVYVVPNGANVVVRYRPSVADAPILFLGPFRYASNLSGIIEFLENVYPAIRASVPNVRISILGGVDASVIATRSKCFQQPGLRIFDYIEDVDPYLESCSLTINPDKAVRGSSLKVIESLAAGRICVSTTDGARGLKEVDLPSLVIANDENFADHVIKLLTDVEYRHRIEAPTRTLNQFSWHESAARQAQIYDSLLETGCSGRTYEFAQAGTRAR